MTLGLSLSRLLSASWPAIDPVGRLLRMDAAYRDRRRLQEMPPELLRDIGLTSHDLAKMSR